MNVNSRQYENRLLVSMGLVAALVVIVISFSGCKSTSGTSGHWWTDVQTIENANQAAVAYEKASIFYELIAKGVVEARSAGKCDDSCWSTFASARDKIGVVGLRVGTGIQLWRAGGGRIEFDTMYPELVSLVKSLEANNGGN